MRNDLKELQALAVQFRNERDWTRFHTPKNLAQAIAVEAGELNDLYLWTRRPDLHRVGEEMADLLIYLLSLADVTGIDLADATIKKLQINAAKYPVAKVRGDDRKYSDYPG